MYTMLYEARCGIHRETAQTGEAAPSKYVQIYIIILCHYNNYVNIFKRFKNWIMWIIPISYLPKISVSNDVLTNFLYNV